MSSLVRKTFSLPEELSDDLEQAAMARGLSASAVATERLRDFQAAAAGPVSSGASRGARPRGRARSRAGNEAAPRLSGFEAEAPTRHVEAEG